MALVERKHRQVRAVAAGTVAMLLVGTAYQASFASGGTRQVYNVPQTEDDDGLETGQIIGIALGGAAVVAAGLGLIGGGRDRDDSAKVPGQSRPSSEQANAPALPANASGVTAVRLVPGESKLQAGAIRAFDLQGRSKDDGRWYSVTSRPEATIELRGNDGSLVRQEGSKNVFVAPITADKAGKAVVVGTYAPAGQTALTTQTEVQVASAL